MLFRRSKPVKHSSDRRRRTEGSTSSDNERRRKEKKERKNVSYSGKSTSTTPKNREARRSTERAHSERRKTHRSREERRPAQGSAKAEETPKKSTKDSGVEKPRSDKRGGTTHARSSERKKELPATTKAQKIEKAPAQTKEGGGKGSSTTATATGSDNWELKRMKAREALRSATTASTSGVNPPGPQGMNDKTQKATGKSTKKLRIYTGDLKKETNENFKLQSRIDNESIAILSSETLRDSRRQMYGPGKRKFTDEEWKDGKLRLYTTDPGNVLVLVPKNKEQQPRIQPVLPPKLDSAEESKTWRCSAVSHDSSLISKNQTEEVPQTFNKDVFHVVEIPCETFLQEIFKMPNDKAEEILLKKIKK